MSAEPLTFELALQILREDNPRAGEDVLRIYTAALRDFAAALGAAEPPLMVCLVG